LTLWFGLRGVGTKLRGEATVGGARGGRFGLRNGLGAARVGDGLEGAGRAFGVKFHFGSFAVDGALNAKDRRLVSVGWRRCGLLDLYYFNYTGLSKTTMPTIFPV